MNGPGSGILTLDGKEYASTQPVVGEEKSERVHLEVPIQKGELFPWKGLWWEVAAINPELGAVIRPVGYTAGTHKRIAAAKKKARKN